MASRIYLGTSGGAANALVNWETFPMAIETDREIVQVSALRNSSYSFGASRLTLRGVILWADDAAGMAFLQRDLPNYVFNVSGSIPNAQVNRIFPQAPIDFWDPKRNTLVTQGSLITTPNGFQAVNTSIAHITDPAGGTFVKVELDLEEII